MLAKLAAVIDTLLTYMICRTRLEKRRGCCLYLHFRYSGTVVMGWDKTLG